MAPFRGISATSHGKYFVHSIGGRAKSIVRKKPMSKNNDVVVQSSPDFASGTIDASHNSDTCIASRHHFAK